MYITGFRGDWKALKQVFNFSRYADKDEVPCSQISHTDSVSKVWELRAFESFLIIKVCWQCLATKGLDAASLPMAYTNVNHDAAWISTEGTQLPWKLSPAYTLLEGFDPGFIHGDILHMFHLGTGRDLVASTLVILLQKRGFFAGSSVTDRLHTATCELKEYCRQHGLPLKLQKLSKSKLNWNSRNGGTEVEWVRHLRDP